MIWCVGVGPGDLSLITSRALELIRGADVISGFEAVLNIVKPLNLSSDHWITLNYQNQSSELEKVASFHQQGLKCVVVFMGDPHFSGFQLLERVEKACGHSIETIPGISSAQILASRARVCFDETTFITFHRRGDLEPFKSHLVHVLQDGRNAIVIPRPWDFMPRDIASFLLQNSIAPNHPTEVWENLTGSEANWKGRLVDCQQDFSDMSIMLIRSLVSMPSQLNQLR